MAARNRVFDTVASSFVFWETDYPDTQGAQYPGPATFGSGTLDYCVTNGVATVAVTGSQSSPDNTFSPIERWMFNGDLNGSNGIQNISNVRSGVAAYIDGPISGSQAFNFTGQLIDTGNAFDSSLEIEDNMSIQLWLYTANSLGTFGSRVLSCAWRENGGDTNNTIIYGLLFSTTVGNLYWGWEDSTGAAEGVEITEDLSPNAWYHLVCTRDTSGGNGAVRCRIWLNGQLKGEANDQNLPKLSSVNARYIRMGDASTSPPTDSNIQAFTGRVHGLTIYDRCLDQHEVIALYKKGLPEADR